MLVGASLTALALAFGSTTIAAADSTSHRTSPDTAIEHTAGGDATRVLVHGIGVASDAAAKEARRFAHSDLQPAARFAEAGDVITVSVPDAAPSMEVAIGLIGTYAAHNDGTDVGYRRFALQPGVNEVTAPHDGMVSMVSTAPSGEAVVKVSGGDAVPVFVRGQSTNESFAADLLAHPEAPFVEVVGDRVFGDFQRQYTGPVIAKDDLEMRTENWDRVVELTNETYGLHDAAVGTSRKHPHRIHIVSPDTGAGYANAGAGRIMFQWKTGAAGDLFRAAPSDQWALWHEIGHTYESPINSFPGTAETITNISALAVQERLGYGSRWDESIPAFRAYFASDDRDWLTANDRVRLLAWEQLRRAFGDGFLPRFFAAMRAEALMSNPNVVTTDERHAVFVRSASTVADRDLAPFFDALGFPVSDATRAEVGKLPPLREAIWDNIDSRDRIVEHTIGEYDPPVGVVDGEVDDVPVGRWTIDTPVVSGLGTASGQGTATVIETTAVAESVGSGVARVAVRLRSDDGSEDVLILRADSVGGDAVVARGQANRVIGMLWIDGPAERLRWEPSTSYSAHTSWSGRPYLEVSLLSADGAEIASGSVLGNQTGAVLNGVFGDRPVGDGDVLLVAHQQPSLLAAYGRGEPVEDGALPQAFRVESGHLVPIAREDIPGWQVISGAESPAVELRRGTDIEVESRLEVHGQISRVTAAVTMHSPEHTVFAPGQDTLAGSYRKVGEDWRSSANLVLRNGTRSEDGRTMTFSLRTGSGFSMPPGALMRWVPVVRVAADAPEGGSSLRIQAVGEAS